MSGQTKFRAFAVLLTASLLAACGGGGGGTGGTGVVVVSSGVMTKGSVILNGVRFEDTAATIVIDDTAKTRANLQDGMVVKVRGTIAEGGGTAQQVEAQIEVRGIVTSVTAAANPQKFVVLGQTVIVDDQTIYSNLANFAAISNTTPVEVHGLRDATGQVRATRIEGSQVVLPNGTGMTNPLVDEIRGVVVAAPGVNPSAFTLSGQQILVKPLTLITPTGATYANGSVVEVHCTLRPACVVSGVFQASRIEVESAEDSAFQPGTNQRFEVEGLVSGFSGLGDTTFFVAGVPVAISSTTVFEGGISNSIATDLADNIKVEAEGVWSGTALVASKIEFKRPVVRLQGDPSVPIGNTFTLQIAGLSSAVTIEALDGVGLPTGLEACVQIQGQRKAGGGTVVVTATQIDLNCSSSADHLIQAPVEAESGTTITLLGFPIDVGNPIDNPPFQNIDGSGMSSTAFFNAVVPANPGPPAVAGTLVKVRFNTPGVLVKQAELED